MDPNIDYYVAKKLGYNPAMETVDDVTYCIVSGTVFSPSSNWGDLGPIKEKYLIGSEGGSAWTWTNGICLGFCAANEKLAICETFLKGS